MISYSNKVARIGTVVGCYAIPTRVHIFSITILLLTCGAAPTEATTIVKWWDSYTDGGTGRYRADNTSPYGNKSVAIDIDDDGSADDSIVYWDYSLDEPLTPRLKTDETAPLWARTYRGDLPSAIFYGGLVAGYLNTVATVVGQATVQSDGVDDPPIPGNRFASGVRRGSGPGSDMTFFPGPGPRSEDGTDPSDDLGNMHAVYLWQRDGFLGLTPSQQTVFNPGDRMAVDVTRKWENVEEGRFVVRDEAQLYISEFTFAGNNNGFGLTHALDPTTTAWAPYDPIGPYEIDFDEVGASSTGLFEPREFTDITGVGVYFERDAWSTEAIRFAFDNFRVDASVVPEPDTLCLSLAALTGLALSFRRRAPQPKWIGN